jgi:serine/threonine protein phosphatase PrpC
MGGWKVKKPSGRLQDSGAHMLEVAFGQATDMGKVRTNNEDAMGSYLPLSEEELNSRGCIFAVADGVGGMDRGEVASAAAINTLIKEFTQAEPQSLLTRLLPKLIQSANVAVHNCTLDPSRAPSKMATTLVACALRFDQAVISHVGDSRCYLIRDGRAHLQTEDHTWVNEQRKLGLITAEDAKESEFRHVLTRSLGPEMFVSPAKTSIMVRPGDSLVLCSDGLYGEIDDQAIADVVSAYENPQEGAEALVQYALDHDGSDNTTAQVIQVRSIARMVIYRGRYYPQSEPSR